MGLTRYPRIVQFNHHLLSLVFYDSNRHRLLNSPSDPVCELLNDPGITLSLSLAILHFFSNYIAEIFV